MVARLAGEIRDSAARRNSFESAAADEVQAEGKNAAAGEDGIALNCRRVFAGRENFVTDTFRGFLECLAEDHLLAILLTERNRVRGSIRSHPLAS